MSNSNKEELLLTKNHVLDSFINWKFVIQCQKSFIKWIKVNEIKKNLRLSNFDAIVHHKIKIFSIFRLRLQKRKIYYLIRKGLHYLNPFILNIKTVLLELYLAWKLSATFHKIYQNIFHKSIIYKRNKDYYISLKLLEKYKRCNIFNKFNFGKAVFHNYSYSTAIMLKILLYNVEIKNLYKISDKFYIKSKLLIWKKFINNKNYTKLNNTISIKFQRNYHFLKWLDKKRNNFKMSNIVGDTFFLNNIHCKFIKQLKYRYSVQKYVEKKIKKGENHFKFLYLSKSIIIWYKNIRQEQDATIKYSKWNQLYSLQKSIKKWYEYRRLKKEQNNIVKYCLSLRVLHYWYKFSSNTRKNRININRGELRENIKLFTKYIRRLKEFSSRNIIIRRNYRVFQRIHKIPHCSPISRILYAWRFVFIPMQRLEKKKFKLVYIRNKLIIKSNVFEYLRNGRDKSYLRKKTMFNALLILYQRRIKQQNLWRLFQYRLNKYARRMPIFKNKRKMNKSSNYNDMILLESSYMYKFICFITNQALKSSKKIFFLNCFKRKKFQIWCNYTFKMRNEKWEQNQKYIQNIILSTKYSNVKELNDKNIVKKVINRWVLIIENRRKKLHHTKLCLHLYPNYYKWLKLYRKRFINHSLKLTNNDFETVGNEISTRLIEQKILQLNPTVAFSANKKQLHSLSTSTDTFKEEELNYNKDQNKQIKIVKKLFTDENISSNGNNNNIIKSPYHSNKVPSTSIKINESALPHYFQDKTKKSTRNISQNQNKIWGDVITESNSTYDSRRRTYSGIYEQHNITKEINESRHQTNYSNLSKINHK
jgi:hypothetical protein